MITETHKFVVAGHKYEVALGGVYVDLFLINEEYDPFAGFGEVSTTTETVNKSFPALRIFSKVVEIVEKWVYKTHPPYFAFSTEDPHKANVYEKIVRRYVERHPKFPYTMFREKDKFWFYKKMT